MPLSIDPSSPTSLTTEETGQTLLFLGQHSRTNSVESSNTDYDPITERKESRFPDIVRRDMEFFMARLTRTTSNDATKSR